MSVYLLLSTYNLISQNALKTLVLKELCQFKYIYFFLFINKHKTKFNGDPLSTKYIWLSSIDYFW